ncbi:MAG: isoprenyl transferase [Alphaproteobacteria bacterium]|nr:isoprenyl transferase [Alphaproteobacteria bacterium]
MSIPVHVGIIMDGNGRWAQKRGLPRTAGHKKGAENLKKVLNAARKIGVKVVTLYAFSSENWARPKEEVDTLMNMFREYLKNDIQDLIKEGVRVSFIGERERFDYDLQEQMNLIESKTKDLNSFHVVLALSYGARGDILKAVKTIAKKVEQGVLKSNEIDMFQFSSHLSTVGIPDPDLIIRTSGESRVSNFLLWELAYAEFYFTPVLWPDFNEEEFEKAIKDFELRQRRFGKV